MRWSWFCAIAHSSNTRLCVAQNSESRHNLSYWTGKQYVGVGPGNLKEVRTTGGCWLFFCILICVCCGTGAHGRFVPLAEGGVTREARTQTLEPNVWIREVQQRGHGTRRRIQLGHLDLWVVTLAGSSVASCHDYFWLSHKTTHCCSFPKFSGHVKMWHLVHKMCECQGFKLSVYVCASTLKHSVHFRRSYIETCPC